MKRPSAGALFLSLVPFAAMCFSVSAWDHVYPILFGLPFNIFWLISWILLTPACMWVVYRLEGSRKDRAPQADPSHTNNKRAG